MPMKKEQFEALSEEDQIAALVDLLGEGHAIADGANLADVYIEALAAKEAATPPKAKAKPTAEKMMKFKKTVSLECGKNKFFILKGEELPESAVKAATRKDLKAQGLIE